MTDRYLRSTDGSDADDGSTWALADATLAAAVAASAATDRTFVSQVHAETAAAAKTITFPTTPGYQLLCGNDAAAPPTALATTGSITTTGNNAITFPSGFAYIYGLTFLSGNGVSAAADMLMGNTATAKCNMKFDNCKLQIGSSSANAPFTLGPLGNSGGLEHRIDLIDTSMKFGATGQTIQTQNVKCLPRSAKFH